MILILPSSSTASATANGCDGYANHPSPPNNIHNQTNANQYADNTNNNNAKNFVRHVTRINISDAHSQVTFDGDSEPVTKEGEYQCTTQFFHFISFISVLFIIT